MGFGDRFFVRDELGRCQDYDLWLYKWIDGMPYNGGEASEGDQLGRKIMSPVWFCHAKFYALLK